MVSAATLVKRASYGGKKGCSAWRRLCRMTLGELFDGGVILTARTKETEEGKLNLKRLLRAIDCDPPPEEWGRQCEAIEGESDEQVKVEAG